MKTKYILSLMVGMLFSFQIMAQPGNDTIGGAIPITPSAEGTGCVSPAFNLPFSTDGTTDSGLQGLCNASGLDQFFTWTATELALVFSSQSPGNPGMVIWDETGTIVLDCASTFSQDATLNGWAVNDNIIIQIYDFEGTGLADVAFCLETKFIVPPPPSPITFTSQIITAPGSSNKAVVDMNNDHLDDIVSVSTSTVNIHFQQSGGGFTVVNIPTPSANYTPSWSIAAGDIDKNGYTDLLYGSGSGVTFMKANVNSANVDNGNPYDDVDGFTEISGSDYVFSQRSNFIDINNDGHLDAFVCHDVEPNVYYINDGLGNFTFYQGAEYDNGCTEGSPPSPLPPTYVDNVGVNGGLGIYCSGGNYGSIWIDYDNDRDLDLFIAKCGGETDRRRNQMHRNNGDGSFTEVSNSLGLDDPMQTWSSAWGDFDNDGDMDVFIGASTGTHKLMRNDVNTSGSFMEVTSTSNVTSLTTTGHENLAFDFDNDGNLDVVSNGNILFGNGDMTFSIQEEIIPYNNGSFGDLNNDGYVDAFVFESSLSRIYMNDANTGNNWIKIHTIGTASNGNGVGARVEVESASGTQIRDVRSGEGFAFMSSLNSHFGLGSDAAVTKITVRWPSGLIDVINNPTINQSIDIVENDHPLTIQDLELSDLSIYPNPANDILNIKASSNLSDRVATVFDVTGKRVLNEKIINNKLNISKLQSGIYILRLEANGKLLNKKFIKE